MNATVSGRPFTVCVYCGSSAGADPQFMDQAARLGAAMAQAGLALVYGGGDNGLMGAVARGVLENGGSVTGIIPQFLVAKEQPHGAERLLGADIRIVADMHTRKHDMFQAADAFVALPGGIGTLEEVIEMLTWAQLRRHDKPVMLLNTAGFWDPLVDLLDHMEAAAFLHNAAAARPAVHADVASLVSALRSAEAE